MKATTLIAGVTAASLLGPVAVGRATAQTQHAQHAKHPGPVSEPLPDAVRRATAHFRDVRAAIAAGYVQFQGCVSGPEEGAMGVHYANFSLFDGRTEVTQPQVLVYEPRNGRLQLVAVEYVAPAPAWDPFHDPFDKPQILGHLYHFAPGPNRYGPDALYELHVWAWKPNPRGTFADWNPDVSCVEWDGR